MEQKKGLFSRLRERLFTRRHEEVGEVFIEEPQQSQEDEIIQGKDTVDLNEQLKMIKIVGAYVEEFVFSGVKRDPNWVQGFALANDIFFSEVDGPVYRSNMEVFFQDAVTGERKIEHIVSLVRFDGDEWRVFQVKEVMPI
jgi:hypothetical protein